MSNLITLVDRWASKWEVALLEVFVLELMRLTPRYGGEMVNLSRNHISETTKVPTIYGMLTRFGEADLIEEVHSGTQDGVTRGTSRKYYGLTDNGKTYLQMLKNRISEGKKVINMIEKELTEEEFQ